MTGDTDRAQGRIVVGVNGTTASAATVRWAVREALLRQASVHLVFADDHDRRIRAPYAGGCDEPRPDQDEARLRGAGCRRAAGEPGLAAGSPVI